MSPIPLLFLALLQTVPSTSVHPTDTTAATPDPAWHPTSAQEQAVRAATEEFLAARDAGRAAEAHAMLTQGMQEAIPLGPFAQRVREANAEAGALRSRRVIRVSWFNDPPGAQLHGIFAISDFTSDYERLHVACGSLIWLLQTDGAWRLFRISEAALPRAGRPNATAEEIAEARRQLECPD